MNLGPSWKKPMGDAIKEVTADKGCHSTQALMGLTEYTDYKTCIPEPRQLKERRRNLRDRSSQERLALLNNCKQATGGKGREFQRLRRPKAESSFAYTLESSGGRRTRILGIEKNQKRCFILAAAHNLGEILLQLCGIGTARSLQEMEKAFAIAFLAALWLFGWLLPIITETQKHLETELRFCRKLQCRNFMVTTKSREVICSADC